MRRFSGILLPAFFTLLLCSACSGTEDAGRDGSALAVVGNAVLTRSDLAKAIPVGLNTADSTRYASAYVRRWVEGRLVSEIASSEIDLDEIDRVVADYRNRLIEMEYRKQMAVIHTPQSFPEDSLREFYRRNPQDFVLERPLVQGLYLKVPEDASNLGTIRKLYRSDNQSDLDRLEKEVVKSAIHYDYFIDKWVDWEQIENHIPYDFGNRPDDFLKGKNHFETTAGGFVYFLRISDCLYTGARMPYDNARPVINERLASEFRKSYDANLMEQLLSKSIENGKVRLFIDINR